MGVYKRKTKDTYLIMTNYGGMWEEEVEYNTLKEAERDLPEYIAMVKMYGGQATIRVKRVKTNGVSKN